MEASYQLFGFEVLSSTLFIIHTVDEFLAELQHMARLVGGLSSNQCSA